MADYRGDRLQSQRFELKYIISEAKALAVRDFVASFLQLDPYGTHQPNRSYPVHSLYLDSDDLALHHSTINGDKNRFKLRLRFYENRPEAPVYFEIKRRMNNTISKQRAPIRRDAVPRVLAGHLPSNAELVSSDPQHLVAAQRFVELLNQLRAKPRVHVSYLREAWLPFDQSNTVRVTLDRQVKSCTEPTARLSVEMTNPVSVFGDEVVLELKYTSRFPLWFGELVRAIGLRQTSAAKYVDGVLVMAEKTGDRSNPSFTPWGPGARKRRDLAPSTMLKLFKTIPEAGL